MLATGQKSYNCQEDSDFPVADNYINFRDYIICCQEEAINMTLCSCGCGKEIIVQHHHKWKPSKYILGHNPSWNKGKRGLQIAWNKGKTGVYSEETIHKLSEACKKNCPMKKPEIVKKVSETKKKKYADGTLKSPFLGKKHTEEAKLKQSNAVKGKRNPMYGKHLIPWNKGKVGCFTSNTILKMSIAKKGKSPSWLVDGHLPETTRIKLGNSHRGNKNINWKGGKKLKNARRIAKRRELGFILLTNNNPYNEPIEYHHIYPDLPYTIPCPKRIHQMFKGSTHFQNVNAMLGIKVEID